MSSVRPPRLLRRMATLLIKGPDAAFILADLDDTMERELARGIPLWRVKWRYAVNVFGSAYNAWRPRRPLANLRVSTLDVKLGLRMLAKNPGLTCVAVFALAIGIPFGMVPAHFVNAIEAPLPFPEGDRIRTLRNFNVAISRHETPSLYDFTQWRDELTTFDALGVARRGAFNVNGEDGHAAPVAGAHVTARSFDIVRVTPITGRTLMSADEAIGAPAVVVIGNDLWQTRFGGDPNIVGQAIRIGRIPHTVVGIMPEGFLFPSREQLWLPLRVNAHVDQHGLGRDYTMFGRLSEDVTPAEAESELATIGRRMSVESPDTHAWLVPEVVPFAVGYFLLPKGGFRGMPEFYLVQALTLLLLVVACVNVAMLVLARTASRAAELAVRTALGASRARIVLQLFTEALVFALLAAGAGLLLADAVSHRFAWMEHALPFWVDLGVNGRTVLGALCLAIFSAGIVSIIPALKVTSGAVQQTMQRAAARRSGVRFGGMSSALIVADVTLAVAAVGLAAGLWDGFAKDGGVMSLRTDQFLSAQFRIPVAAPYEGAVSDPTTTITRVGARQMELVRRLKAEPAVRAVAVADVLPGMDHGGRRIHIDGMDHNGESHNPRVLQAQVDVDFFLALQQSILAGRGFRLSDLAEDRSAVIVNTTFVDQILQGRNPIGRRVRYEARGDAAPGPWYEIVGVVGSLGMNEALPSLDAGLYHPLALGELNPVRLAIRVGDDPHAFTPKLREIAAEVDPTAVISDPVALDEVFSFNSFTIEWTEIGAVVVFGILVGLSVSGIYALMSFTIAQRTRELGIRAALGAGRNSIVLLVAGRAFAQLGLGVLLGTPIAGRLLFELRGAGRASVEFPIVVTLFVGLGVMILIATLGCTVPTLRALRIMPTEALKCGG